MAGTRLVCTGFIETGTYAQAKQHLKELLELTEQDLDDRLEALVWALHRESELVAAQVGARNLWVCVTDYPHLRIYLRPRMDVGYTTECELLWIEEAT